MKSYIPSFIKVYREHNIGLLAAIVGFVVSIGWAAAGIPIQQHHPSDVASYYSCGTAYGRPANVRTFDFIPFFELNRYNRDLVERVASSYGMHVMEEKPELTDLVGHLRNLRNTTPTVLDFFLPEYSENGRTFRLNQIPQHERNEVLEEICEAIEQKTT